MPNTRILVTYATWAGTTHGVADAVAEVLRDAAAAVDVMPVHAAKDVSGYDVVIAGAGVHAGQIHAGLSRFIKRHRQVLAAKRVAYFVVCLTMAKDTPENRCTAEGYLSKLRKQVPEVEPVDIGLFAGGVLVDGEDYERLSFLMKKVVATLAEEGDHRDWEAIRAWAEALKARLLG